MYRKIYYAETRDIDNVQLTVEIWKDMSGTTTPVELELVGESPIVINYEGDGDLFKPLLQSSCTLSIATGQPLFDLYTGKLNEIYIKVFKDSSLFWYGFLSQNVYSQEYEACENEFQIEFIDAIANLENVKFRQSGFFSTFYQYIVNSLSLVDSQMVIDSIVLQNDLPVNLKKMGVCQRNFIDESGEEDEAMSVREVLESLMKWIGKTMFYFVDKVYLLDFSSPSSNCILFDIESGEYSPYQVDFSVNDLLDIGINGSSCSISLGDVYNKVNIIENTNKIDNSLPDILNDDVLVPCMPSGVTYIEKEFVSNREIDEDEETVEDKTYMLLNAFFVNPQWAMPYGYNNGGGSVYPPGVQTGIQNDHVNLPSVKDMIWYVGNRCTGILWRSFGEDVVGGYKLDGNQWLVNVPMRDGVDVTGQEWYGGNQSDPKLVWKIGSADTQTVISEDNIEKVFATTCIQKYSDYLIKEGEPSSISWKTILTIGDLQQKASLNYMYYGDYDFNILSAITLVKKPYFIAKGGYFIFSMNYYFSNVYLRGNTSPYKFTDEKYGEALEYSNSDTSTQFRDDIFQLELRVGNMYFNGNEWVTTPSTFKVKHTNTKGDKIFGVEKSIDNTVSYRYSLANSMDGYAIKLPDYTLSGELFFRLWPDVRLGGMSQLPNIIIPYYPDSGWDFDGYLQNCSPILSINITKLELVHATKDSVENVYTLEEYDNDILFTNVIDDKYVKQMDDVQLTTNTYSPHAVSWSYVLEESGNTFNYVEQVDGKLMEERLCEKYVEYYSLPKLTYSNNLNASTLTPFSIVHIPSLDKDLIVNGIEYDLAANRAKTNLVEY